MNIGVNSISIIPIIFWRAGAFHASFKEFDWV